MKKIFFAAISCFVVVTETMDIKFIQARERNRTLTDARIQELSQDLHSCLVSKEEDFLLKLLVGSQIHKSRWQALKNNPMNFGLIPPSIVTLDYDNDFEQIVTMEAGQFRQLVSGNADQRVGDKFEQLTNEQFQDFYAHLCVQHGNVAVQRQVLYS